MRPYFENKEYIIPFNKVAYIHKFISDDVTIRIHFLISVGEDDKFFPKSIALKGDNAEKFLHDYVNWLECSN